MFKPRIIDIVRRSPSSYFSLTAPPTATAPQDGAAHDSQTIPECPPGGGGGGGGAVAWDSSPIAKKQQNVKLCDITLWLVKTSATSELHSGAYSCSMSMTL